MAKIVITMQVKDFDHWHPGVKGDSGVRNKYCEISPEPKLIGQ